MKRKWDNQTVMRVSAESRVDARTIRRWLAGEPVRESSTARILEATKKLRIK